MRSRPFRSLFAIVSLTAFLAGGLEAQTPGQLPGQAGAAVPSSAAAGENQQSFEIKVSANHTEVNPDLRDEFGRPLRSFLTPGPNITADFSYFQDYLFGTNRLQVLSIFRSNDDPRVDPEKNSLQRGYLRLTTPNSEWNFGDGLVSYSRLTYNQNIKGVSVSRKFGHGFRLAANGGVFTDRWGSVWKDDLLGKPYTRVVAGLRAEQELGANKLIGFNFSHGRDLEDSIDQQLRQFGLIPLENNIGSVDTRLRFGRVLTVDGELAYSSTNFDTRVSRDSRQDYGGRLDASLRAGRFFARTSYLRLMPSFLSLNARQLADLQDSMVRAGLDVTEFLSVEGSYRRTNNNLRSDRPEGTTVFEVPEVRASLRRIPMLGRTVLDFGVRERQQSGPIRRSAPFTGLEEDRHVRIPFVEVVVPLGSTMISVGYEHRRNTNELLRSEGTKANRWSGSLRGNYDVGGWNLAPMFRYEMEREEFFRVIGFNNNRSILASGFAEAPKYFAFEVYYRQVGATLFAECLQVAGGVPCHPLLPADPGTTVLLPSGFRRPAFRAAVTYKLANNDDRFLVFAYDRNVNLFALPDRDFRERVFSVTLVLRFRR